MKLGASFTAVTVIVKVCEALVSAPLLAVPALSCSCTVTVAVPLAFAAGVKVSVPEAEIVGCAENTPLLLFVTRKSNTWLDSSDGPALSDVTQPVTV